MEDVQLSFHPALNIQLTRTRRQKILDASNKFFADQASGRVTQDTNNTQLNASPMVSFTAAYLEQVMENIIKPYSYLKSYGQQAK